MQLTKREQTVISLLLMRPRTGAELAEALAVSRRTVVREIASINTKLEAEGAGRIESEQSYRLQVVSEERLTELIEGGLSDELAVLLSVLTLPEQSLSGLAQETYLSRRALQATLDAINRNYEGIIRLEPRAGRGVEVTLRAASAADLLASLAAESPQLASRLEELAGWERAESLASEAARRYLEEMRPYVSSRQVHLQTVAAMASAPHVYHESDNWAVTRLRAAEDFYQGKRSLLFELVTHRAQIVDDISELLRTYGIHSTRADLCSLVFDHVVRCALFPTIMSSEMGEQMRDMRLRHPFEFDFGDDLCARLREFNPSLFIEPDFVALYVLASMERPEGRPVSVLVLCHRPSMSTINQRLIEQNVEKVDVRVVCDDAHALMALGERDWDLTVRDEDSATSLGDVAWDMRFRGVLSTDELRLIRRMALDILYRKNLSRMLSEGETYFHLHNAPGQTYLAVLEDVLDLLVGAHRVTADEAGLIRGRERAGKRLNLAGIAFPHAITPVESDGFRILVVRLDEPAEDLDARIELVVVILASQSQGDKSSIFTYLLSVIEDATSRGVPLPTDFAGTVRYLTGGQS